MNYYDDDVDQRVAAGAAWLDEHGPAGWRARIDRDRLNIAIPGDCVLGQLYGDYFDAPRAARIIDFGDFDYECVAAERGFDTYGGNSYALNEAWRKLLAAA